MYTVFLADDELIIRQGLKCIIEWNELGFEIIGEASNGADALQFILNEQPDVVMMDIRMPKLTGLEVVKQAREEGYQGKIIILSGFSEFSYAKEAIRYGVEYYLTKPIDEDELKEVIGEIKQNLAKESEKLATIRDYRNLAKNQNTLYFFFFFLFFPIVFLNLTLLYDKKCNIYPIFLIPFSDR